MFLEHNVQETSKDIATLPFGSDQSLKKAAPVTAVPMEPSPVRCLEEPWVAWDCEEIIFLKVFTLAGWRGREMYWYLSQASLGFVNTWSCSCGWSGTFGGSSFSLSIRLKNKVAQKEGNLYIALVPLYNYDLIYIVLNTSDESSPGWKQQSASHCRWTPCSKIIYYYYYIIYNIIIL